MDYKRGSYEAGITRNVAFALMIAVAFATTDVQATSVRISGPSSVYEGDSPFTVDVSLSMAPMETITVTVSSSDPSSLKIIAVDRVGSISADNAVIRFAAGQTGPYSVTLDPRDGYNYASNSITVTATADKTYSSASHNILVLNEAPSAQVSQLDENGEWVLQFNEKVEGRLFGPSWTAPPICGRESATA